MRTLAAAARERIPPTGRGRPHASVVRSSSFSFVGFSTTLSMGGVSFSRPPTGQCVESIRRIRRLRHLADPQHSVISPRGIDDIDIHEAAVVQRHQGNRRRERTTGVEALVDRVAALLERRKTNVRVFDREQLENPLPQKILIVCGKWLDASTQIQFSQMSSERQP
jgi:hypothetical protein